MYLYVCTLRCCMWLQQRASAGKQAKPLTMQGGLSEDEEDEEDDDEDDDDDDDDDDDHSKIDGLVFFDLW